MLKFVVAVLLLLSFTSATYAQTSSNPFINGMERGRREAEARARLADDQANSAAQRDLVRAQAELLKAQRDALQREASQAPRGTSAAPSGWTYPEQEFQVGMTALNQRHPDWKQYQPRMVSASAVLLPTKGLSAYDYLLGLYTFAKQKTIEDELDRLIEEQTKATLAEFTKQYPDWKQYEQTMVKLGEALPPRNSETDVQYMKRLYDLAKQK